MNYFHLIITVLYINTVMSAPTGDSPQNTTDSKLPDETRTDQSKNKITDHKSVEELVKQQTDTVKKIVADQQQQIRPDYPVITKLEPQYTEEAKKQSNQVSLEELKIKCQHLSKLLKANKTSDINKPASQNLIQSTTRRVNNKTQDLHKRPVYVQLTSTTSKPSTTLKPTGFYITSQRSTTRKPGIKTQTPIKIIRLEPVILQKTVLNDGRIVYYWHRSLPTAVEFANDATKYNYGQPSADYSYSPYNYLPIAVPNDYGTAPPYGYPPLSQNSYVPSIPSSYIPAYPNTYSSTASSLGENTKPTEATTQMSSTTTTEQSSYSGYGFGSFLPFYSLSRQDSTTSTTTEPTTTTTTTPKPTTEKAKTEDLLYAQQLRFVIPVPYETVNGDVVRRPWDFDQYAYYPKELQPKTVNVQVPYTPTFHMITAVAVPDSQNNINKNPQNVAK